MAQKVLEAYGEYTVLDTWFAENHVKCALLVCGKSVQKQKINDYLKLLPERLGIRIVRFMDMYAAIDYDNISRFTLKEQLTMIHHSKFKRS